MMQISNAENTTKKLPQENIRSVKDISKPGIVFKDITPLPNDKHLLEFISMLLANPFRGKKGDHVVGLESISFGTNLTQELHTRFIPIKKSKKLAAVPKIAAYELEYGTDLL